MSVTRHQMLYSLGERMRQQLRQLQPSFGLGLPEVNWYTYRLDITPPGPHHYHHQAELLLQDQFTIHLYHSKCGCGLYQPGHSQVVDLAMTRVLELADPECVTRLDQIVAQAITVLRTGYTRSPS